ncbi:unnamed protein product [Didymodactylos carnosus]|uniref:V-SNARE coiled-coil homology domain-containing protein n=1 Tax=Didymodactylos carnosus TaxID=1234261 RepID=A0A816BDT2_9BILA|nr:unnamed protein product [Didymodactylos carnosus]CAF4488701.1 unnamed protein product [Didymodactylos carnosus]
MNCTKNEVQLGLAKINRVPSNGDDQTINRLAAKALIRELQHFKQPSSAAVNKGSLQTRFQQQEEEEKETTIPLPPKYDSKQRILDLSLKYNILSPHTSFVGIEKRANGSNTDMVLREVPIQISADDQHLLDLGFRSSMVDQSFAILPCQRMPQANGFRLFSSSNNKSSCSYQSAAATRRTGLVSLVNVKNDINSTVNTMRSNLNNILERKNSLSTIERRSDDLTLHASTFSAKAKKVKSEKAAPSTEPLWPKSKQDIVRHLIDLQKFDGLWNLTNEQIEKLTNKSLSSYQSQHTTEQHIISSAIVIVVLEQKHFEEQKKLWQACVDKTKRRLIELLGGNDSLELLLQEMREQVSTSTSLGNFFTRLFK